MGTFNRGFKTWAERTAIAIRRECGHQPSDPLPASDLAAHLGVGLLTPDEIPGLPVTERRQLLESDPDGWSGVTIEIGKHHVVIYNPRHSGGRIASDQMHELAHIVIGHAPSRMVISPDGEIVMRSYDQKQEDEAAWLSGCLLLPREALLSIARSRLSDGEVCKRFCVSPQMLKSRRNLTGVARQMQRLAHGRLSPRRT